MSFNLAPPSFEQWVLAFQPLRLCVIRGDGTDTLVSITHRCSLVDAEGQMDVTNKVPIVDMSGRKRDIYAHAGKLHAYEPVDPDFPGWDAVFDYLDAHPELLTRDD